MRRGRQFFVTCLTLASVAGLPVSAKPSPSPLSCASAAGVKTLAEVEFIPSQDVYSVNVTFIGKRPPSKEIDRVLRDCVLAASKRDGSKDMLGSPWFRKRASDNPNEDELLHPYGGLNYLSYEASSRSIGIRELKLKKK